MKVSALIFVAIVTCQLFANPVHGQLVRLEVERLFDGKSLKGWLGDEKFWSVEDGVITGQTTAENPTAGNTFLIWQGGHPQDFKLSVRYKIEGGNSGIQFRSKDLGDHVVSGYQADIDAGNKFTGILYEERGRGILAQRTQHVTIKPDGKKEVQDKPTCDEKKLLESLNKDDGWNQYQIRVVGNQITQTLNDHVTVMVTDEQTDNARSSGIIALQLHAGPPMKIQFSDIVLTRYGKDAD